MKTIALKYPKQSTKTVWVGMYGGHYDVIVFFHKKPKASEEETETDRDGNEFPVYDLIDNENCIAGAMWLPDFHQLTGATDMLPEAISVIKLHKIRFKTMWDGNKLINIDMFADGWGGR